MIRNGDVYTMATYSQLVNVFGAVKTSKLGAALDPVGAAIALYSSRFAFAPAAPAAAARAPAADSAWPEAARSNASGVVNDTVISLDSSASPFSGAQLSHLDHDEPVAMAVRALASRSLHAKRLRVVGLEIEGVPGGYAAGDPSRLVDGVAALSSAPHPALVRAIHAGHCLVGLHP
jgi:hypothetical protein